MANKRKESQRVFLDTRTAEKPMGTLSLICAWGVSSSSPEIGIALTSLAVFAVWYFSRKTRIFVALMLLALPYALGAYIAARTGVRFYPYPPIESYWLASRDQLVAILLCIGIALLTGLANRLDESVREPIANASMFRVRMGWLRIVQGLALTIVLWDATQIATHMDDIFAGQRHVLTHQLVLGLGVVGIALTLSITATLAFDTFVSRASPILSGSLLFLTWAVGLTIGERAYTAASGTSAVLIILLTLTNRRAKALILGACLIAVGGLFFLPSLWSKNAFIGFNEWILPNSLLVSQHVGAFTGQTLGVTPFIEQWPLLLPNFIRPYEVLTLTNLFADYQVINVSVGGNPWAETYTGSTWSSAFAFSATTLVVIVMLIFFSRFSPLLPIAMFGMLAFWGRLTFWGTATLVMTVGLLGAVLFRLAYSAVKPVTPSCPGGHKSGNAQT